MIVQEVTQSLQAWRYTEELAWPEWVKRCCLFVNGELVHERSSGRQVLNPGEWLVRDLDGEVNFYTDDEFKKMFQIGKRI